MEALLETTVWENVARQPNHIYLFDGQKAVAYIKWGEGAPEYFSKPMTIDKRGRKFVKADARLFKVVKQSTTVEVKGSKGNSYFVDIDTKTCTCPGFNFRGACKHITEVCGAN
jgi:hypothetical protein